MNTEAEPQQLVAALAANAQLRRRLTHATTECFRLRQERAKEAALHFAEARTVQASAHVQNHELKRRVLPRED